ncbi:MAG: hypothetical protein ACT4OZ_16340 [Gemmatimonadota bacterium]
MPLLAMGVAAAAVIACDDPLGVDATTPTRADTLKVFAMTGTPASFPSGYSAGTGLISRIEPEIAFDVVFDLSTDGRIRVIPARLISQLRVILGRTEVTQQVSLQVSTESFESIGRAPGGGYKRDSIVTVTPGQTVLIEVQSEICSFQFTLSSLLYAKLVVDSVRTSSREIFFRAIRNPNCGFRSFAPGIPRN